MSDRAEPVPDDVWEEAVRRYDEQTLAALVVAIANTQHRADQQARHGCQILR